MKKGLLILLVLSMFLVNCTEDDTVESYVLSEENIQAKVKPGKDTDKERKRK